MSVSPFANAPVKKSYTREHKPLIWEAILGTLFAKGADDHKAKYFDYDYEKAHEHVQLQNYEDLRVCRVKDSYQGWPQPRKWALFGVRKISLEQRLADAVEIESIYTMSPNKWNKKSRSIILKKLLKTQLKEFDRT